MSKKKLSEKQLSEKKDKFKITSKGYEKFIVGFLDRGYTTEQSQTIIFKQGFKKTIARLFKFHEKLIEKWTREEITRVASYPSSAKNIKALLKPDIKKLNQLNFSSGDLIRIIARSGGHNNLKTLIDYVGHLEEETKTQLEKSKLLPPETHLISEISKVLTSEMRQGLIKLLAHNGGYKNFEALTKHEKELNALGFSRADLIRILAHSGGHNNLQALINYVRDLKEATKIQLEKSKLLLPETDLISETSKVLTPEIRQDLVKLLAHTGGYKSLKAFITHEKKLNSLGFSRGDLIRILAHTGCQNNLKALIDYVRDLKEATKIQLEKSKLLLPETDLISETSKVLTPEIRQGLLKLLAHDGGYKNLEALTKHEKELNALGFSRADLIRILAHSGGHNNLQALINYVRDLKEATKIQLEKSKLLLPETDLISETSKVLTPEIRQGLVKLLAYTGGYNNLEVFTKHEKELNPLDFSRGDRIRILAHGGGYKSFEALIAHEKELNLLGFSRGDLIRILAHNGGHNNLQGLINYVGHLKEAAKIQFLTPEIRQSLVKLLDHNGGYKNLEAFTRHEKKLNTLDFSRGDLIRILAHDGGHTNLQALINYVRDLKEETKIQLEKSKLLSSETHLISEISKILTPEIRQGLVKLLAHDGGYKNLELFTTYEKELNALDFSRGDRIRILDHDGGYINLEALINYVRDLKEEGKIHFLTPEIRQGLVKLLAHNGGYKNLEAFITYEKELNALDFSRGDQIKILAHDGGHTNFKALINYVRDLKEEGKIHLLTPELRQDLVKLLAHDGGHKNLAVFHENKSLLNKLGIQDRRVYKLLQREVGYQRLHVFLDYYFWFHHHGADEELFSFCSKSGYLQEELLRDILALKALLCHFEKYTDCNTPTLLSWIDDRFFSELQPQLGSILEAANRVLQGKIQALNLENANDKYYIVSKTDSAAVLNALKESLNQYSLEEKLPLKILLNPNNARNYRLLRNPEGNRRVYYLDTRTWKTFFPYGNLQHTLIKLLKKGLRDSDILPEEMVSSDEITPIQDHFVSIPVQIVETILDDYLQQTCYKLVLSEEVPVDCEIESGCLYLYKTNKTLEGIVKEGSHVYSIVFNTQRLTPLQYGEILGGLASKEQRPKLHRSTLEALSLIGGHPLQGSSEIEIIDESQEFFFGFPGLLDKFIEVDKLVTLSNERQPTQEKSGTLVNESGDNTNTTDITNNPVSIPVVARNFRHNKLKRSADFSYSQESAHKRFSEKSNTPVILEKVGKFFRLPPLLSPIPGTLDEKKIQLDRLAGPLQKKLRLDSCFLEAEDNTLLNKKKWKCLGEGTYNTVYFIKEKRKVIKIRKNEAFKMDAASRASRVYNEINKALHSEIELAMEIDKNTWMSPYVDGDSPPIQEKIAIILDIYLKTGRVFVDGYCKNILKEHSTGKNYCTDPGLVVRRNSEASYYHWYAPNEQVANRRNEHYKYMQDWIKEYKQRKQPEESLPIFCIFGIDYYDRFLLGKIDIVDKDLSLDAILVLGIAVYYSLLQGYRLDFAWCGLVLRQKIEFDVDRLINCYAEEDLNKLKELLRIDSNPSVEQNPKSDRILHKI